METLYCEKYSSNNTNKNMQRYYKQTCNSNIDESATSIHLSHEEPLPYFAIKKHRLSLSLAACKMTRLSK